MKIHVWARRERFSVAVSVSTVAGRCRGWALAALAALASAAPVGAASLDWNGSASSTWTDAANWTLTGGGDGDGIPDADDDVTFPQAATYPSNIVLNGSQAANTLIYSATNTFRLGLTNEALALTAGHITHNSTCSGGVHTIYCSLSLPATASVWSNGVTGDGRADTQADKGLMIYGQVSGSGQVIIRGNATMFTATLGASNSLSGGIIVDGGGWLGVRASGALGVGSVVISNGDLLFYGATQTVVNPIVLTTNAGSKNITCMNVPLILGGGVTVPANATLMFGGRNYGQHLVILAAPLAGGGGINVFRGGVAFNNTNQFLPGNVFLGNAGGDVILDRLSWTTFTNWYSMGYGTGARQWQTAGDVAARGAALVMTGSGMDPGGTDTRTWFDRAWGLGSNYRTSGVEYADAPVTAIVNTVLSSRRTWTVGNAGPALTGAHGSGITHAFLGNIDDQVSAGTGASAGALSQIGSQSGPTSELLLGGTNRWTGSAKTGPGPGYGLIDRALNTGKGGMAVWVTSITRFLSDSSLPAGATNAAYLAACSRYGGDCGYLLTGAPGGQVFDLPSQFKFVLGAANVALFGSSGPPGSSATFRDSAIALQDQTNAPSPMSQTLNLVVRDGTLVLGEPSLPVKFQPSTGYDTNDIGINALATVLSNTYGPRSIVKYGMGTVALTNIAYTLVDGSGDTSTQFLWQVGRGIGGNQGAAAYFDGAVRGLADNDPAAGNSNSLRDFNLVLKGGVYEVDGRGAASVFTRPLGSATNNVTWSTGGGGFSACLGPLTVSIGGTATTLTWASTANFVANNDAMIFGSRTANDIVSLVNTVALNSAVREIRVIDNAGSDSDRAVLLGPLTGAGSSGIVKNGDGILELAASNTYNGATIVTNGALWVNGALNGSANNVVVYSGGTLGGTGVVYRPVVVATNGAVAPGATNAGTLTVVGNLTFQEGAIFTCLGGKVQVNGTLTLPTNATVNVVNQGVWTLFSATALAGATDLGRWRIVGQRNCRVAIVGTDVVLRMAAGTLFVVH